MKHNTLVAGLLLLAPLVRAGTTIDAAHPYAYGANIGWLNAQGNGTNGAAIGQSYCTGALWSATCGWISLGSGPANGWRYGNASATDWGVNHDGAGNLSGYAYGANIGWVTLEQTHGQPRIDLRTGRLSGHAWGANVGWIALASAPDYLHSTLSAGPDSDSDALPDAWEYRRAGSLRSLSGNGHDADGDGTSDLDEYAADTDPGDLAELFKIVSLKRAPGTDTVTWTTRPTRLYRVETTNALPAAAGAWADAGGGLISPPANSPAAAALPADGSAVRFYRVRAVIPLGE